ncbi:ATP-binding protein [bacterium]|nr:ATP-binding protein [bacterium]
MDKIDGLTSIDKSKIKRLFGEYFEKGGFPEFLLTEKDEYLVNLYENVLYRDIITRYNIRAEKALKVTSHFAASNIGKELSFNNLKNMTGLTSATTIKEYFQYLENSYLVFLISRFSTSLKKQIYYNKKAYFIDLKLANLVGFRSGEDKGRMLENIVFLQLKRKNKEIFFHKAKKECDFVLRKNNRINEAIQVTWRLGSKNEKREMDGLLEAMDEYDLNKGLILTYEQEENYKKNSKQIKILPVWKWFLI